MVSIDEQRGVVTVERDGRTSTYRLDSPEAFAIVSDVWLRSGWDVKHVYTFTWLGRPVIQLPEDLLRLQEVVTRIKPDVIIETGVAHGGSLVFYASLCRLLERGRVIGIDIDIRPHNRAAIEAHALAPLITLIEGNATDPSVVAEVRSRIGERDVVLVILDSNHTKSHVLAELRAYAPLVTPGSYLVAMDGHIMQAVAGRPRTRPEWAVDNPVAAVREFVAGRDEFVIEAPAFLFDESAGVRPVSYSTGGFIKRVR